MEVARIGWVSPSRIRRMSARISERVVEWLGDWSVGELSVAIEPCSDSVPEAGRFRVASTSGATLAIGVGGDGVDGIGSLLAASPRDSHPDLAHALGLEAIDDLLQRFMPDANGHRPMMCDRTAVGESLRSSRRGAVAFSVDLGGRQTFRVLLDSAASARLAPPNPRLGVALTQRAAAIADSRCSVGVALDLGRVTLEDVLNLQIGDVIRTNSPLSSMFHLALGEGAVAVPCRLVRSGPYKAVVIESLKEGAT